MSSKSSEDPLHNDPTNGDTSSSKVPAPDGKVYFSYADVHNTCSNMVPVLRDQFRPDVIVAIGGGGFIPARILRTQLKVPILAVSLELYDDKTNSIRESGVCLHQWYDESSEPGKLVHNGRVLIVDEVDDTRTTLQYCVQEVLKRSFPAKVGVFVVHNKLKEKKGTLPSTVEYFAGENVPDRWNCYPWDAESYNRTIVEHEALAQQCSEPSG